VANLQQENRRILALEEENRQLRCALKEMENGLQIIMGEYRHMVTTFDGFDLLSDLAKVNKETKVCQILYTVV
jgi:hypothetical protein